MRILRLGLLMPLLWTFTSTTSAQEIRELEAGSPIEAALDADGRHSYVVDLGAGLFVVGEVHQQSMDVVVTIFEPEGHRLTSFDVTPRGLEPFSFSAEAAGSYRIEVSPFQRDSGDYRIELRRVEPLATTPEKRIDQLMAVHTGDDRPGGVVALIRAGEVEFAQAYGVADLTHGVPITTETLFNIGSVSKQFAGFFFAMMAEEGRLSIDDDVRKFVPELPDFGTTVTLRNLLNHTSGYREVYGSLGLEGRSVAGDILLRRDAIEVVRRQPALQFAPGSRYLYNSTAYVILTEIAERLTGEPYPDWMKRNVFDPLGMTRTHIEREPGEVIPGSAYSYRPAELGGYREDFEAYAYYGATDVYTNVYDLARWLRNFRTHELGGAGVMRRMTERTILAGGDTLGYTLGLVFDDHLGLERIQHGGSTGGYRTFLAYYPALGAAVVVLANTGAVAVRRIADEAASFFLGEHARPDPSEDFEPEGVGVAASLLAGLRGTYWIEGTGGFTVTSGGAGLMMETPSGRNGPLIALDDSTFWFDANGSIRFHRRSDGTVPAATLRLRGEGVRPMRRLPESAEGEVDLRMYTGRYFSDEVEAFYTISESNGKLQLEHRRLGAIALERRAADLFLGPWPVREVAFERSSNGEVTGFRVTEGRTIGVEFRRIEVAP